jgi:hypothetical protein
MASGAQSVQQQREYIDRRLKNLLNDHLREICKAYGKQVSGNKAILQGRCVESESSITSTPRAGLWERTLTSSDSSAGHGTAGRQSRLR